MSAFKKESTIQFTQDMVLPLFMNVYFTMFDGVL